MAFTPGFNSTEAEPLLAMLAALEGTTPPPLTQPPWPSGWNIIYDSQQIGPFDNRWQLASNSQGQYAILIRGTIYAAGSIIDDLLSVMIPANASIGFTLGGTTYSLDYQLAAKNNTNAGVHLGFTLAMFILMYWPSKGIIWQLVEQGILPGSDIFIAGHSQGAAIATLCRSYLNYLSLDNVNLFGTMYNYKTYVFAQPKPGNDLYGYDYNSVAGNAGLAYTVNNSQDWVPQAPLTLELPSDINTPNPLSVLLENSAALANVTQSVNNLKDSIALAQASKHLSKMDALRQVFTSAEFQEKVLTKQIPQSAQTDDFKPVLPNLLLTLNFTGCGAPYSLLGVPGTNPCDAKDFFWQHHGAMYYDLLTGTAIPTECPD
ncbi:MAG: hypothetical protein ICV60_03090 [Pyrinomonadaceae bacterium]|nr:hypothetical protein [Pyrinomonadaceae bacterium]